ncbi:MAG TPA: hypothetical protein VMX35_10400 [Acidobacteriota bacterium]|nr:hypothetical protein [Acidobacteriota bacterium]
MSRRVVTALALSALLVLSAATQDEEAYRDAYKKMYGDYRAAETQDAKLDVLRGFLKRHPDGQYTRNVVSYAVRLLAYQQDNIDGALEFVASVLEIVKAPKVRIQVMQVQADLYGKACRGDELQKLAMEMAKVRELDYLDRVIIARNANACELWDLALEHYDAAIAMSTREAVVADLPPDWQTEQRIQHSLRSRLGSSKASKGWALVNSGRVEEGLAVFREAERNSNFYYVGMPKYGNLYVYWGRALMELGDYDGAIEKFAPAGVMMGDEDSVMLLRGAYVAKNGSKAGFEQFRWDLRLKLAKPIEDFAVTDYQGRKVTFSSFKGKVVLLNFWYPT